MRFAVMMIAIAFTAPLIAVTAHADSKAEIRQRWADFQKNPQAFMDRLPPKKTKTGVPATPKFSPADIRSRDFVLKKSQVGPQGAARPLAPRFGRRGNLEAFGSFNTDLEDFVDSDALAGRGLVTSLATMDAQGLQTAQLVETPWSSTYWPIARGIIADRYAATSTRALGWDFKSLYDFTLTDSTLKKIYDSKDPQQLDTLSPAEKYDLLLGDLSGDEIYENGYLTPSLWRQGKSYYDSTGQVDGWMGICHGWSPAAFEVPRPRHSISTKAADGQTDLKFYPSDLKGLASYMWSLNTVPTTFLGSRCNVKNPARDPDSGRILDESCFDVNPAIWHLGVVNQIGVAKKSFVLDATYDFEVWNQPAYGYSYTYFNPQTGEPADSAQAATVQLADYTNDKFGRFRSPKAVAVVGVSMDMTYVVETAPNHSETDSADNDATTTANYMYDLELDADGNIIGGEWYTNAHPDFMWVPAAGEKPSFSADQQIDGNAWQPGQPIPAFWRQIAIQSALSSGQPVATIINALVNQAQ